MEPISPGPPRALSASALLLAALLALPAAAPAAGGWIEVSDGHSLVLIQVMAEHTPERAARLGVEGVDERVLDLREGHHERYQAALQAAETELRRRLDGATHPKVRQDLQILIDSAAADRRTDELRHRHLLPWLNLPETVFRSVQGLLDPRIAPERRPAVRTRIERYAGSEPGYRPMTELARARIEERMGGELLGPYAAQVRLDLGNAERFIEGSRALLAGSGLEGWQESFDTLAAQLREYMAWAEETVLPLAREDHRLPAELYEDNLRRAGIDLPPERLVQQALTAFAELQLAMDALAVRIAERRGWQETGYREVLARLKGEQIRGEEVLPLYLERLGVIERLIREHDLVSLPAREAVIRLGDEAESAANPAPHMSPPRLLGNTGEYGEFVLPMRIPGAAGRELEYDDFTYDAATWPLTAHEARPGHELQFSALVEMGVSIARMVFAMNSVNVEGWALYFEGILQPYLPLEGQLATLQFRLMRAARAFLDPRLNLGETTVEEARRTLMEDVVLSEAMAQQEVDRYSFRAPGQAPSYFYGYQRLMELRARTAQALREGFDPRGFHDFILAQGVLPPDLLALAVLEELVPQRLAELREGGGGGPTAAEEGGRGAGTR